MAPSRNRHKAPRRQESSAAKSSAATDASTAAKISIQKDRSSPASSSSRPSSLSRAQSTDSLRSKSNRVPDVSVVTNGPRPSIDDDNVEGDPDLMSPHGDISVLNLSPGGRVDETNGDDDDDDEDLLDDDFDEQGDERIPYGGKDAVSNDFYPLQRSNSTPILIPSQAHAFAPPFYNRPPTPLPPSPSLTSLLRPSFSSRPTTPDDSESEVAASGTAGEGSATEAVVAKSARLAKTVPRASPKVPTYEYYGFVLYLTSGLCFLMYLLWSYLPSPFLHQLGIYYYPNRWWSLAVPAFLVMLLIYIYVALAAYNTEYLTQPLGSINNFVDEAANIAAIGPRNVKRSGQGGAKGRSGKGSRQDGPATARGDGSAGVVSSAISDSSVDWRQAWSEGTDAVMDVPIGGVCEILYGDP